MAVAFFFMGPVPFVNIQPTVPLIQVSTFYILHLALQILQTSLRP